MVNHLPRSGYVLGLDVGEARIGAALASMIARLPQPLAMIPAGEDAFASIKNLIDTESVSLVVVGLPRDMNGHETEQTAKVRQFTADLEPLIGVPVVFADETLSSVRAEQLAQHTQFKNVSQDSLAACFILEEFFSTMVDDRSAT
jgi:putative Holliday junction resolvase